MHYDLVLKKMSKFAYKKVLNKTIKIANGNANEIWNFHVEETRLYMDWLLQMIFKNLEAHLDKRFLDDLDITTSELIQA